ncbi:MAG: ATP-binding cassette domain-containing protein [Acidobacteria bacterium]|nr:ATP-binding cassette domain-containing protein [Acidobacteriota bacterium]
MIQLSAVTKSFGDRVLFQDVTWQVADRECVGLCGPNGAGKTTLLRIFAGLDEADIGSVTKPADMRVGYLPQDGLTHEGLSLYDEVALAFQWLLDVKQELERIEARLGDASVPESEHEGMLHRYSDLQDRFRLHDGYAIDLKIDTVLRGLGFGPADYGRPTAAFSGGWQMRIALAKLLLAKPDLLLLDEPTNHLDLDARNWLEEYLHEYPHAVILVSHDRFFLDAVVDRITDIHLRTLTDYACNYSQYLVERDERLTRLRDAKRRQDEEMTRVKQFIDRFRYQATKAAQVQSRIKMLEKVVPIEVPPERKRVHFSFPTCEKSGRMVFSLEGIHKAYGATRVFDGITLHMERGDRIALLGPNGAGKSTLMRMLSCVEEPDRGTRTLGHQVVMQYFAQDEAVRLDPDLTVYETLSSGSPLHMVPMIRDILGGFLFSGDDVYKRVGVLSGGERTRLAVARMLLRPSNTLLLDEPTNHLDLDSKDVLLDALMDYGGTLIVVSHDRYFIDKLATKVIEIGNGQALLYPGTYEEFHWSKTQAGKTPALPDGLGPASRARQKTAPTPPRQRAASVSQAAPTPQAAPNPHAAPRTGDRVADYEAKKRGDAEARKRDRARKALAARIADLEGRIADREQQIKDIEATMSAPGFYEDRDASKPVIDRHQALMWEVGDLMGQWEALHHHAKEQDGG